MRKICTVLFFICLTYSAAVLCQDEQPTFKYVTSYNKEGRFMTKDDIEKSSVNVLKPIIFIIGGLTNSDKNGSSWSEDLQDAYLEKFAHNVFIVDWNFQSAKDPTSIKAAHSVGSTVGDFMGTIFNKTGEAYLDIHLVGVSLGAEVAASAAGRLLELSGRKINRVTGLDPSYYLISEEGGPRKLSSENADFVDVVHTNWEEEGKEDEQTGHVDFYVDDAEGSDGGLNKSKPKSVVIFARSVNSNITAVKCDSTENFRTGICNSAQQIIFGENTDRNARGKFFLKFQ